MAFQRDCITKQMCKHCYLARNKRFIKYICSKDFLFLSLLKAEIVMSELVQNEHFYLHSRVSKSFKIHTCTLTTMSTISNSHKCRYLAMITKVDLFQSQTTQHLLWQFLLFLCLLIEGKGH